jgi:hypothetical protein
MKIERLSLPTPGQRVRGWCLYRNDRWNGECPQEEDELGFFVYADKDSAWAALARELRVRLEYYEAGKCHGAELETGWYPMEVTWFDDGHLIDATNSEQWPAGSFGEEDL